MRKDFLIIGTDTGVGKTVLSLHMMKALEKKGQKPLYFKPFQTGCSHSRDTDSDAWFVYRHLDEFKNREPGEAMHYVYKAPLAPWFAARREGRLGEIDISRLEEKISSLQRQSGSLVIEGAGGVLVPVTDKKLIIDIFKEKGVIPVIAARAGLGTINHTLLTVEALKSRGLEPGGIVLIQTTELPEENIQENIEAIETFSGVRVSGVIETLKNFNNLSLSCLDQLLDI